MEIASIKPHHHHADFDFSLNPSSHSTKAFVVAAAATAANGINNNSPNDTNCNISAVLSDIEMITFQAAAYTSLKDLIPTSTASPSSVMSPTTNCSGRKDSWREIPIKDPLLQHAAWAYLQPMAPDHDARATGFFQQLKDHWCGIFGCFNDVVLVIVKSWFSSHREEEDQENVGGACGCG